MSIVRAALRRPVATTLVALSLVFLGCLALIRLPIASLPAIDRPTFTVFASLPGASAETLSTSVAAPLERYLGLLPGLTEMTAFSSVGAVNITMQFSLDADVKSLATLVQSAINAAIPDLPSDMPYPPRYYKANPAGPPVIALALTSSTMTPSDIYEVADSIVSLKLAEVSGVARVLVNGAERRGIRIRVDTRSLADMGISTAKVRHAVQTATSNGPVGMLAGSDEEMLVGLNGQLLAPQDYADIVVDYRNGAAVRLGQVAQVTYGPINSRVAGWYGQDNAVVIWVLKHPEANTLEIIDTIRSRLGEMERILPGAVKINVVYDRTVLIRASVFDLQFTIVLSIALVGGVVFLFLRSLALTAISSLAIPVSLGCALVGMYLLGFSLNNLSIMGLTIAIGFVVDDAIIVLEQMHRLSGLGHRPAQAALLGIRRVSVTILAMTAALAAALIPLLFLGDILGRLFREFSVTLLITVFASAIIAITLVPMLFSRVLVVFQSPHERQRPATSPGRFVLAFSASLDLALRYKFIVLAIATTLAAGSFYLYSALPKGYLPTQDIGILRVRVITNPSISFASMRGIQRQVADAILSDAQVVGITSFIGTDNGQTLSNGTMLISLTPRGQRGESIFDTIARLRINVDGISDARVFFTPVQDINIGTATTTSRYQYTMYSSDTAQLERIAEAMRRRMAALPELRDVISNAETSGLKAQLLIDRNRLAMSGLTMKTIDDALYDAFGQRQIRTIFYPRNYSRIVLEAAAGDSGPFDLSALNQRVFVPVEGGELAPLSAFTTLRREHAAVWAYRQDQYPAITLSFNTKDGVSLSDAISAIRRSEVEMVLPPEIVSGFRGEAKEAISSRSTQQWLFVLAVVAIYIILGVIYESFSHPLVILTTLPPALFGALVALHVTSTEFTIIAFIGCLLVAGIVMKNAIIMVDFALQMQRRDGLSPADSIRRAALLRVKPIVMTTLVAAFGALPLALGHGEGAELRQPLGITVIGGLLASQLLSLYVTPAIYVLLADIPKLAHRHAPRSA